MRASFALAKIRFPQLLIALGVFTLFIVLQTYLGFFQMHELGSDQINEGVMILKRIQPKLYVRDYAFSDASFFRVYTPLYLWLVQQIMSLTKDYALALLLLLPGIMMVYLVGMFVLISSITKNPWIAILTSLISSLQWPAFTGELWGVAKLQMVMPRTFFCALTPWLLALMFQWLQLDHWWEWPLLAFLSGLGANLHPVSALAFTELLISMLLLARGTCRRKLTILLPSVAAATAGAWPILFNFLGNTSGGTPTVPFERFSQVMLERFGTLFFSELTQFKLWGHTVGVKEREILVWIYIAGMIMWGVAFILFRVRRFQFLSESRLHTALFALQLPVVYLLTWLRAPALVIAVAVYWAIRNLKSEPDQLDKWCLNLMTLINCYSFLASFVLGAIWARFELWSLTSLMAEQLRTSRFIYVPLFILAARFMQITIERLSIGRRLLLIASAVGLMAFAPSSLLWSLLVGLTILVWCYGRRWIDAHEWIKVLLDAVTWALALRVAFLIIETPTSYGSWLALCLAVGYALFTLCWRYFGHQVGIAFGIGTALLFTFAMVSGGYTYGTPISSWVEDFASAPSRLWTRVSPLGPSQISEESQDELELYDWALERTSIDSLFYYDSLKYFDSLEFRFQAQRSVTHCWKDLGLAYYTKVRLVEFYDRYQKFQGAYKDTARLLAYAHEEQADYIVIASSRRMQLNLPIVFENPGYVVYQLEQKDANKGR